MFEFFGNIFYLSLLGLILLTTCIIVRNAWSEKILSRRPNALFWNNSLIISYAISIIATFFIFSWIAGVTTIILAFIVYAVASKKIMMRMENNIFNSTKK